MFVGLPAKNAFTVDMRFPDPVVTIGRHSYGLQNVKLLWPQANVSVGAFCSFAPNIRFVLGNNHRTDWVTTYPFGHKEQDVFGVPEEASGHPSTNGDIVIGNDVWVGYGVTIMSGVTVGDGAVIAANSHVVKDVAPYSITGGNPAKHIKYRFEPEIIEALLDLKWWDRPDKEIRALLPLLLDNPDLDTLKSLCK